MNVLTEQIKLSKFYLRNGNHELLKFTLKGIQILKNESTHNDKRREILQHTGDKQDF